MKAKREDIACTSVLWKGYVCGVVFAVTRRLDTGISQEGAAPVACLARLVQANGRAYCRGLNDYHNLWQHG